MNNEEARRKFNEEVNPIIQELKRTCKKNNMPFFVSVCYDIGEPTDEKTPSNTTIMKNAARITDYSYCMLTPYDLGVHINNDKIGDFIKIVNGFHVSLSQPDVINPDEDMILTDNFEDEE